jgi:hypothetical protein
MANPSQNLNGAVNRNPTAVDRTGIRTFSNTPMTATAINDSVMSFTLSTATNIALPANPPTPLLIRVGDELMRYSGISGTTIIITERGALNTRKEPHAAGMPVTIEASRPDGLFADQIVNSDILDLRHLVNPNGFDYETLLRTNFDKIAAWRHAWHLEVCWERAWDLLDLSGRDWQCQQSQRHRTGSAGQYPADLF